MSSEAYQDYYTSKYEQTSHRIDTLNKGGLSQTAAQRYAVGLAIGDVTGFTDAAEAAGGADTTHGRILTSSERLERSIRGGTAIAGTMATAVSISSKLAASSAQVNATSGVLCLGPCDQIYQTAKQASDAAKKIGYSKTNYKSKFGEPVYERTKAADRTLPRYISRDIGNKPGGAATVESHNAGAWKGAQKPNDLLSKTCKSGTYNACMQRIGD